MSSHLICGVGRVKTGADVLAQTQGGLLLCSGRTELPEIYLHGGQNLAKKSKKGEEKCWGGSWSQERG